MNPASSPIHVAPRARALPAPPWPLQALLLALAAIAVYLPARTGEFVSDDLRFVVDHADVLEHVARDPLLALKPETNATPPDPDIVRPLRTLSFAVDHARGGVDSRAYHATSILLHALNAVLVLLLARGVLRGRPWAAWFAAAAFALHPLGVEAVAWISSRADLLVTSFVLLSLRAARAAESGRRLATLAAFACAFLAGLAKESGVVLPVLVMLERRARGAPLFRPLAPLVAVGAGTLAYLAVYAALRGGIDAQVSWYGGSFLAHLPYGLLGVAYVLRLALGLAPHHFLPEPAQFVPMNALDLALAVSLPLAAAAGALVLLRARPAIGAGLAFFLVALLPAANLVLPMRTLFAERFAYLPLVGLALAAGALLARLTPPERPRRRTAAAIVAVSLLAAAGWATARRAAEFASARSLYSATLAHWPRSAGARMGLADLARQRGDHAAAERLYREAAALSAADPKAAAICELAAWEDVQFQGRHEDAVQGLRDWLRRVEAEPRLRLELARERADAAFAVAIGLGSTGRLQSAAEAFQQWIDDWGATPRALDALGEVRRAQQLWNEAQECYDRALALDPNHHPARLHRAELYARMPGLAAEAARELRELLIRDPANERAERLLRELGSRR